MAGILTEQNSARVVKIDRWKRRVEAKVKSECTALIGIQQ